MSLRPFIKLLRTPKGFFFYDVNRDSVRPIGEDGYHELEQVLAGNADDYTLPETICLRQEGYLSEHRPQVMEHPLTEHIESILHNQMYHLCLQVTQSCNLSCIYCPYASNTSHELSRTHSAKTMTFDLARKAIDYLAANSAASPEINLSFYGGEPLIAYPLIHQCIEYAQKIFANKRIQYLITTNATLLTDEMIDFFAQHHVKLTFSLDGPRQIHDRHRLYPNHIPTYDTVIDKLERTVARYGEKQAGDISINMVLNPTDPLDTTMAWLQQPLLKRVIVHAMLIENDMLEHKFIGSDTYDEKYNYRLALSLLTYLDLVRGLPANPIVDATRDRYITEYSDLQAESGWLADTMAPSGPCVPGGKKLFVSVDGGFYPCEKVNELSEGLKIGDIDTGIDMRKAVEQLNICRLTPQTCADCWALTHCNICQRSADDGHALSAQVKLTHCARSRDNFLATLHYYLLLRECKTAYHYLPEFSPSLRRSTAPGDMQRFLLKRGDRMTGQESVVIGIGALMKGIDTAKGTTGLYHALTGMGYRVGVVTANPGYQEVNAAFLPINLSQAPDHSVAAINQFFNWFQLERRPDIILMQLPDEGLHRMTCAIETCFGVYTYMISQAIDIDYSVMYSPAAVWNAENFHDLSVSARSRFGFGYDAMCIVPAIVNLAEQADESTVPYTPISRDKVAKEVADLQQAGDIRYFLETDDWYQAVADDIVERLS